MSNEPYLKTKNLPLIVLFILWCIALYMAFHSAPHGFFSKLQNRFDEVSATDGFFVVLSPLIALILTGIISSENKARLVFWRFSEALPGHRAFSVLAPKDPRIDMQFLKSNVDDWPQTPKEEYAIWYRIYRQYSGRIRVVNSHKAFLLSRDLATIAFLFAIIGPWGLVLIQKSESWAILYAAIMISHYLLLTVVARNHGKRFVCNVLAEYVTEKAS